MRSIIFRVLAGILGSLAALVAIAGPVLTVSDMIDETKSAHQYGGHPSFWGGVGGLLTVFILSGFCALIAYMMFRFSIRRAKAN